MRFVSKLNIIDSFAFLLLEIACTHFLFTFGLKFGKMELFLLFTANCIVAYTFAKSNNHSKFRDKINTYYGRNAKLTKLKRCILTSQSCSLFCAIIHTTVFFPLEINHLYPWWDCPYTVQEPLTPECLDYSDC